jgi:hypothetical protein
MISSDSINIIEIQQYIEKLPNQLLGIGKYEYEKTVENKLLVSSHRLKKDGTLDLNGNTGNSANFNPNKTFGGEKARIMFPMKDFEEPSYF